MQPVAFVIRSELIEPGSYTLQTVDNGPLFNGNGLAVLAVHQLIFTSTAENFRRAKSLLVNSIDESFFL